MQEITRKSNIYHENFPKSLHIKKTSIIDKNVIADRFNKFFVIVGPNLAAKILPSYKHLEPYLPNASTIFAANPPTAEEVKKELYSLKMNKTPGYYHINASIIKNIYDEKNPFNQYF